jgi:hypothetical protein
VSRAGLSVRTRARIETGHGTNVAGTKKRGRGKRSGPDSLHSSESLERENAAAPSVERIAPQRLHWEHACAQRNVG